VLEADADVERAVEAVLQERAEALVATGLDGALSALERLRAHDAGRAVLVIERPEEPLRSGFVPLGEPLLARGGDGRRAEAARPQEVGDERPHRPLVERGVQGIGEGRGRPHARMLLAPIAKAPCVLHTRA
jgi:hypothetical protein